MNSAHDMGGMHGFGAVKPQPPDEGPFHEAWEGRVHAMNTALRALGLWNLDADRHTIENLPPHEYLRMSYYERWAARLFEHVVRYRLVSEEEIATGRAALDSAKGVPALTAAMRERFVNRGIDSAVEPGVEAKFRVGERVRTRNIHPEGHTRLPRYVRSKVGEIVRDHGVYLFPDTNAHGRGEQRQHCYAVQFTMRELWGEEASAIDSVTVDLWDDYLARA
ncbi:MAG: nitrile hydratase subunit beta [Bryobacteraceae bacterium]|nr:nitrile hydratase subunit beta [Bryobacteraceae bacterium]